MLRSVTAIFNINQDAALPPYIYSSMYNSVTSLLIDKLSAIYPSDPSVLDMLDPFVEKKIIPITNGVIQLPENYRNILGSPQIAAKNAKTECTGLPATAKEFNEKVKQSGCTKRPIVVVPQAEFAYQTTSSYGAPDTWNPLGYKSGKKQITVCPANLTSAEVLYVREEKLVNYGYIMQPDDTYIFDEATSVQSEWSSAAFTALFKGITACYAAYSRDPNLQNWSQILNQANII